MGSRLEANLRRTGRFYENLLLGGRRSAQEVVGSQQQNQWRRAESCLDARTKCHRCAAPFIEGIEFLRHQVQPTTINPTVTMMRPRPSRSSSRWIQFAGSDGHM